MHANTLRIGFMLFVMFFGAANLIFPPQLGWMSGEFFWPAIIGFLLTGVGLPLLGIMAGSFSSQGIPSVLEQKVNPIFSLLFMIAIYLSIGPLFAIPRTATTSFEIGLSPIIGNGHVALFIFSLCYFAITLYLSLKPRKMVDVMVRYLIPVLVVTIIVLCIISFFKLNNQVNGLHPSFVGKNVLTIGFMQGYNTMDAIASIAFAIIIINSIKNYGISEKTGLFKYCCYASIIAGSLLGIIYLALGWIGNHHPIDQATLTQLTAQNRNIGAYLLSSASNIAIGNFGPILLALMVLFACLTTTIALVVAVSEYFHLKFPVLKYETYTIIFSFIGFVLANQGLQSVIKASIPVLIILYPITIVLIIIMFIDKFIALPNLAYQVPLYLISLISIAKVLFPQTVQWLPLINIDLEWIIPAVLALFASIIIGKIFNTPKVKMF